MSPIHRVLARHASVLGVLAAWSAIGPAPALHAQAVEPRVPVEGTTIGGRMNLQMNTTTAEGVHGSEFKIRRARIWVGTRINRWIDGAVQVEVAGGSAVGRFAFVRLSASPAARISFGQFKRAFDLFELTSSSQTLVIERDGGVRGAADCAGIGGVCSYSGFSERLLLSSLDIGLLFEGQLADSTLQYLVSVTNGPGSNTGEENSAKSVSGRVVVRPADGVRIGVNAGVHDYPNPVTGSDAYAPAAALDVELGDFEGGLHIQAGVLGGQNWRNLDAQGGESRFLSWQTIVSYRVPLDGTGPVRALEPVGRLSWGDPDRDAGDDGGLLLTPGFMVHFEGRNKVAANIDVWRPQTGGTVWGLKAQTYLYF